MGEFTTADWIKLRNIQQTIEKATHTLWENLKKYPDYSNITEAFNSQADSECEKANFQIIIRDIFNEIKAKQDVLKDGKETDITDFQQFKTEMIGIQDHIQNLKLQLKSKLEKLNKENIDLTEDVEFYSERLIEWSEPVNYNIYNHNSYVSKKITRKHQCKEMKNFMQFVHKSNGHENGWAKEDHQLFIKYRQKHKNPEIIAERLHEVLPDISIEDIKKHNEWYKQYLNLKQSKKNAVKAWQASKKDKNCDNTNISTNKTTLTLMSNTNSLQTIQEKLKKWKTEKESQLQLAREIELLKLQKEKQKEEMRKKHNEELRKIVLDWRQTKTQLEQQQLLCKKYNQEEDKRKRAAEAKKMIREFQTQDDMYVMKMLKCRQQKELKIPVRSKSSQLAARNPDRLLKPTKQWINRVHDENSYDNASTAGVTIKTLPKLGIPQWRRQLHTGTT